MRDDETAPVVVGDTGERQDTIARPSDEEIVYRADPAATVDGSTEVYPDGHDGAVSGTHRPGLDVPATIGGALAALGTLLLLSSLVGAVVGTIGYQSDIDGRDLSVGGLVGGLVVLVLACLVGGWVAGRLARRQGGRHGFVAILWLVVLAAVLAALAAIFGDDLDVRDAVGLPDWFSSDSHRAAAIGTGVLAAVLMLLAGWFGGRLGARRRHSDTVELVATRRRVRTRDGGIGTREVR